MEESAPPVVVPRTSTYLAVLVVRLGALGRALSVGTSNGVEVVAASALRIASDKEQGPKRRIRDTDHFVAAIRHTLLSLSLSHLTDVLDDTFVGVYDPLDERADDLLERALPLVGLVADIVRGDGLGEIVEVIGGSLDGEEDANGEDVECVMASRGGERAFELVFVAHL